jgi:hypothetical protein
VAVSTNTVYINIVVQGGASAARVQQTVAGAVKGTNSALQQQEASINRASKGFSSFSSAVATFKKAIISMIGVLIIFNLFITLPEMIIKGIVGAFKAGVEAVAEFQEQIVGLTAIIASSQKYSDDMLENYKEAGRISSAVMQEFLSRGKESLATTQQLMFSYQKIMVSGSQIVKNHAEAVDLAILLTNSIAAITSGQDLERQLSEEITSLFTQQNRATAMLNKFLFGSTTEMHKFWEEGEAAGDTVEKLKKKLSGFVLASTDLGSIMRGVKSSFIDIGTQFAIMALGGPIKKTLDFLIELRDRLTNDTERIKKFAAVVSSSVTALFESVAHVFGFTDFKVGSLLNTLESLLPRIVGYLVEFVVHMKNLFMILKFVAPLIWHTAAVVIAALRPIMTIAVMLGRLIGGILDFVINKIEFMTLLLPKATREAINGFVKEFSAKSELAKGVFGFIESIGTLLEFVAKAGIDLKNMQSAEDAGNAARTKANRGVADALREINKLTADRSKLLLEINGREKAIDVDALLRPINARMRQTASITKEVNKSFDLFQLNLDGLVNMGSTASDSISNLGLELLRLEDRIKVPTKDMQNLEFILSKVVDQNGETAEATEKVRAAIEALDASIVSIPQSIASMRRAFSSVFKTTLSDIQDSMGNVFGASFVESILNRQSLAKLQEQYRKLSASGASEKDLRPKMEEIIRLQVKLGMVSADTGKKMLEAADGVDNLFKVMVVAGSRGSGFLNSLKLVYNFLKNNMQPVIFALGNAFGDVFQKIMEGTETALGVLRKFLGEALIMFGKWAVSTGLVEMIGGLTVLGRSMGMNSAAGAKLMAVGLAAIAAGVAIAGSAGKGGSSSAAEKSTSSSSGREKKEPEPYWVRNQEVAAQQGIQYVLEENSRAVRMLNGEISRLSKEKGDVLVTNTIKNNPKPIVNTMMKAASRSLTTRRNLGGALTDSSI